MSKLWYTLLLIILAGCGPISAEQLRANPGGIHSFKVAGDYQAVYKKVLSHAQGCAQKAAFGENASIQGNLFADSKRSSISIVNSGALGNDTLFAIDIVQIDNDTTEVKVFYALHRYERMALLIEDWIKKNSKDCVRGKVVLECAC
jgi:hypothetical protein